MELFGMQFSEAQLVLLGASVLLVLLCIAILRKLGRLMPKPAPAAASAPAAAKPQAAAAEDDGELIAVITAAVAAMMGKEATEIKVASCKEIKKPLRSTYAGRSAWSKAGRQAQVNRYI